MPCCMARDLMDSDRTSRYGSARKEVACEQRFRCKAAVQGGVACIIESRVWITLARHDQMKFLYYDRSCSAETEHHVPPVFGVSH